MCAVICRKATLQLPYANFLSPWCQSPSSRAQNRGFCALLGFGTLDFRRFEHKIGVFVRFQASEPSISGVSSTKSGFLCAFGCLDPRFLAFHSYWRNIFGSWSNLTTHLWWLMYLGFIIQRIASSCIVGSGDIEGCSEYFYLNLSANSVKEEVYA